MEAIDPGIPRPAATLIPVRPQGAEFQVYLLKRNEKSGFMGGYYVFPGGVLEADDCDTQTWQRLVDCDAGEVHRHLGGGLAYEDVLAYGVAALRETWEEAGVLLGGAETDPETGSGFNRPSNLAQGCFKRQIGSTGRKLAFSRLHRWAHWITPRRMKRRYDTRFFLAVFPEEQVCRPDCRETVQGVWLRPQEALKGNMEGKIPLSPPTLITLSELSGFRSLADLENALKSRTWGEPLYPRLIPLKHGAIIIEPWDPLYREEVIPLDEQALENALLPLGAPFSKIWLHDGIWRPIA